MSNQFRWQNVELGKTIFFFFTEINPLRKLDRIIMTSLKIKENLLNYINWCDANLKLFTDEVVLLLFDLNLYRLFT